MTFTIVPKEWPLKGRKKGGRTTVDAQEECTNPYLYIRIAQWSPVPHSSQVPQSHTIQGTRLLLAPRARTSSLLNPLILYFLLRTFSPSYCQLIQNGTVKSILNLFCWILIALMFTVLWWVFSQEWNSSKGLQVRAGFSFGRRSTNSKKQSFL